MALTVATNNGALMAQAAANSVNKSMENSMERLATGKRINSAADDAAGVAIASRLTSEIRGTNQAIRNSMDAQALIDTAEGAHQEVVTILQRMRELSVQGASDTNNADDRTNIKTELGALGSEINRISAASKWAGTALINNTSATTADFGTTTNATSFTFHVGSGSATTDQLTVNMTGVTTISLNLGTAATTTGAAAEGASLLVDTTTNALATIVLLDNAIKDVNTQRAELGSASNRLDNTVSNLTNMSANLSAGRGRIEDADFAAETTNLAKTQILQQASTAMLAQANASKQGVLSLLQG